MSWCLKSLASSHALGCLFNSLFKLTAKYHEGSPHYWLFVRGVHWWPLDSPQKGPATWWHQMETISTLLDLCEGNSPVTGEYPSQRPVMQNFDVFFDLCLNKQFSKQSRHWWFEMPLWSLWRHCNECRSISMWWCLHDLSDHLLWLETYIYIFILNFTEVCSQWWASQ